MQSSKNQLNAFNKIMLNQFKENWLNVAMLVIIITVTGILAGALMAETFRRITQSILNKSTIDFGHSLLFLAAIILTNFISQIAITSWTPRGKNLGHGWSRRIYP